jgi:hypothetical protein
MTNIIPRLIWDLSANFEALQAVTKDKKLVIGPGAGHPGVPRHFFLRFGLSSEAGGVAAVQGSHDLLAARSLKDPIDIRGRAAKHVAAPCGNWLTLSRCPHRLLR